MKSKLNNGIRFATDDDVHQQSGVCGRCMDGYPLPHSCGGNLHSENRFDIEAGITEHYRTERCDGCDYERDVHA